MVSAATARWERQLFHAVSQEHRLSACTSIVAQRSDGTILHCRNLDYGIAGLNKLAVAVNFTKAGRVVYRGVTFAGYVGLLTGVKEGAFSVSVDERWTANGTVWTNVFEALFAGGHVLGFELRDALENEPSYSAALGRLQVTRLISVCYLILGGVSSGEGAVITRDRDGPVDVWELSAGISGWVSCLRCHLELPSYTFPILMSAVPCRGETQLTQFTKLSD